MARPREPLQKPRRRIRPLRKRQPPPPQQPEVRARVTQTRSDPRQQPAEQQPLDYTNDAAVYSTGGGSAEMYHFHREPTYRDQYAEAMAQEQQQREAQG